MPTALNPRISVGALILLIMCCPCGLAQDSSLDLTQYAHTAWKVRDGFTKGAIYAIAQTHDGYLWLGTELGLFRFDGIRAVPWQAPNGEQLPSNTINGLLVAHDGALWIGTLNGLVSWKDGKLKQYQEVAGTYVGAPMEDRGYTVWFGTFVDPEAKLCAFREGSLECHSPGTFGVYVRPLYQDRNGNIWFAGQDRLWGGAPGALRGYAFPRGVTNVNALTEDAAGRLLLATNDGLKQLVNGRIENCLLPGITGHIQPTTFLRRRDGSLWIGTTHGLLHFYQGKVDRFSSVNGLSADHVNSIFEDREGDIWVATQEGLDRFREYSIPTISRNQGLSSSAAGAVQATLDGGIWIVTPDAVNRWANGHTTIYRSRSPLAGTGQAGEAELAPGSSAIDIPNSGLTGSPASLGLDDAGRLWTATTDGVFYFERGKFVRAPGIPGGSIFSFAGDGRGNNVWILHYVEGLFYWSSTKPIQRISWSQFKQGKPRSMLAGREPGSLWLGFQEGGVAYLKDGKALSFYGPTDSLGKGRVTHLRIGSRGGLWVATEGGLSRIIDGRIETLNSKNGLPCDEVHWSMEDDNHFLWVYMPCGLARVEGSEWHAWIDNPRHVVKATIFDDVDGVTSVGVYGSSGPHVTKSPDGRIWFVTRAGVSVIDPQHLVFNTLAPPVHVEKITADGETYDSSRGLHLPPLVHNLAIDYTAQSMVAPEKVLFRYQLEGFDHDWQQAGTRRQAFYTNLSPGNYHFRVIACNNSGIWNEAGATLDFSIAPAYYQTIWFRAFLIAVFAALLWWVYQLRRRYVQQQFNIRLETRVNERTRIARELHDTLLQSFHGLMFRFQAARNMLPGRPQEASQALDGAIARAEEAIAESRDAIQDLRSATGLQPDLAQSLRTIGQELAGRNSEHGAPLFRVMVEGERRRVSAAFKEEICRIARELLQNAFQHARAHEIEAEIRYEPRMLRLLIRDDGKGIDAKVLQQGGRPGHWGLPGIRERAQQIGAEVDFWSETGAGTEIQLTVPAAIAYEKSQDSSGLGLFRRKKSDEHHT